MLPVRVIGGPGKEVPPERARTTQRKKELSAPGGIAEENAETRARNCSERICPPLVEDMLMPLALRLENERRELHPNRPIDGQKGTDHEAGDLRS
jgi:hypothetical protein